MNYLMGVCIKCGKIAALMIAFVVLAMGNLAAQTNVKPYSYRLRNAQDMLQRGAVLPALDSLDGILADYPDADDIYFTKAVVYGQMRNSDAALDAIKNALDIQEKPEYLSFAVDAYKAGNNPDSALLYLDKLITRDGEKTASLKRERIMLLYNAGYKDVALDYFYKTREVSTPTDTLDMVGSALLIDNANYQGAIDLLKPWADQGVTLSQVYGQLAQAYVQNKNPKQALAYLEKGLQMSKDDYLYFDLADFYRIDKKIAKSFEYLQKGFSSKSVDFNDKNRIMLSLIGPRSPYSSEQLLTLGNTLVETHPRIAESHMAKGQVQWMREDMKAAESSFAIAVGINPYQVDAWRMLMSLDMDQTKYDQAIAHGAEALRTVPNNATILYFTSMAYVMKKDSVNSRKFMEAALNNAEHESPFLQANIYAGLGDIYHGLKMERASDAAYTEAIRLDSTNVSAMNNLAYYLALRKERLDDAANYAKRATTLQPNVGTFEDTYAWVLFQQGNYQEALVWIQKAIKNSSSVSGVLLEHYGDILAKLGKVNEAVKQWQRALNMENVSDADRIKIKQKIDAKQYVE